MTANVLDCDLGIELHVDQIGIIVPELESTVERYGSTFGIEVWRGWTYDEQTMTTSTFRGGPGAFAMEFVLGGTAPQIELIEPRTGPSIYHEHLEEHGPGLHHVGCVVQSLAASVSVMEEAGYEVLQSGGGYGVGGDGGFAYFDTFDDHCVMIELIEVPEERREPDSTWRVGA